MNIAFTSIVLFLILAPGFVYRLSYTSSRLSLRRYNRNIVNELTWSIIPSIILQVGFLTFIENVTSYRIDFNLIGNLLFAEKDANVAVCFQNIRQYIYPIFWYNVVLFGISYVLGHLTRRFIRWTKLDRHSKTFRFSNKWYYILRGECLDFPHVPDSYDDIYYKIVDVLCKVNGETVIYIGEMFDYYLDNDGNLEAIHLRYPVRRYLKDDNKEANRYYDIASRFLIIPMSDIININVRYFNTEKLTLQELETLNVDEIVEVS